MNLPLCRGFLIVISLCDLFWRFWLLKAVVFLVIMCVINVGSGSEIFRFCSVLIYVSATNVLLAEKSLRLMRFVLLKNT